MHTLTCAIMLLNTDLHGQVRSAEGGCRVCVWLGIFYLEFCHDLLRCGKGFTTRRLRLASWEVWALTDSHVMEEGLYCMGQLRATCIGALLADDFQAFRSSSMSCLPAREGKRAPCVGSTTQHALQPNASLFLTWTSRCCFWCAMAEYWPEHDLSSFCGQS